MLRNSDLRYVCEVDKLLLGGTYSNENIMVRLLADLSIGGLWCARDDQQYVGKWTMDVALDGQRLKALTTEFAPGYQRTRYGAGGVTISKTVFVPVTGDKLDIVFVVIEATNAGKVEQTVSVFGDVRYPEMGWAQFVKHPDREQRSKRVFTEQSATVVVARTQGREDEVRVIGGAVAIAGAEIDDQSAKLAFEPVKLAPGVSVTLPFALSISPYGVEQALLALAGIESHRDQFERTQTFLEETVINTCQVGTPDALINRAISWAKVNSFRQRTKYPSGYGFTNDPPQDVVVVRDAAWFVLGSDYLLPEFSAQMLELIQRHGIERGGKLTEYIQCCEIPPYHFDYDLNINDDTPLYIYAVHHHYCATKDEKFLERLYPTARDAANWIIAQIKDGLVFCTAEESNVWGICSWRNIIPGYTLSGAVTEINSECYHALCCIAELAAKMGEVDKSAAYQREADALREAINTKLRSSKTGHYLLNRDTQGVEHHDLTGDLVFPAMFGVAGPNTTKSLLDILHTPMFWTQFGMRTVAVGEENYDPEFGIRLVGGIWPNLTVWVSYANRKAYPERMVEGMQNAYRICEVDNPKQYRNLVPGEFPECLHGENFESRGMALSPWMPPTYLWLAVEGILGIEPTVDGLKIYPNLPADWNWALGRRIPYGGSEFSMFVHDGVIYTTQDADTSWKKKLYDEDVSHLVSCSAYAVALKARDGRAAVLVVADINAQVELTLPQEITREPEVTETFPLTAGQSRLIEFPAVS